MTMPRLARATAIDRPHPPTVSSRLAYRAALIVVCIAAVLAAVLAGDPAAALRYDPELALLLRGMAAIKTSLVAAAVALLAWRLGVPVRRRIGVAYLVGLALVTGSTTMIWQLSSIVPAAALFHLGLLTLLVAAWRDEALPNPLLAPHRPVERRAATAVTHRTPTGTRLATH